jgi:acyl carrier protein
MEHLEEIRQKTRKIVLDNLPNLTGVEGLDDTNLFRLGLDSINSIALVLSLEDAFGVEFEMYEISYENFRTIADIVELMKRKVLH